MLPNFIPKVVKMVNFVILYFTTVFKKGKSIPTISRGNIKTNSKKNLICPKNYHHWKSWGCPLWGSGCLISDESVFIIDVFFIPERLLLSRLCIWRQALMVLTHQWGRLRNIKQTDRQKQKMQVVINTIEKRSQEYEILCVCAHMCVHVHCWGWVEEDPLSKET